MQATLNYTNYKAKIYMVADFVAVIAMNLLYLQVFPN